MSSTSLMTFFFYRRNVYVIVTSKYICVLSSLERVIECYHNKNCWLRYAFLCTRWKHVYSCFQHAHRDVYHKMIECAISVPNGQYHPYGHTALWMLSQNALINGKLLIVWLQNKSMRALRAYHYWCKKRYLNLKWINDFIVSWMMGTKDNIAWWRHQMKAFFSLRTICALNSPVTGEFPA